MYSGKTFRVFGAPWRTVAFPSGGFKYQSVVRGQDFSHLFGQLSNLSLRGRYLQWAAFICFCPLPCRHWVLSLSFLLRPKIDTVSRAFTVTGTKAWSSLPFSITSTTSHASFKLRNFINLFNTGTYTFFFQQTQSNTFSSKFNKLNPEGVRLTVLDLK